MIKKFIDSFLFNAILAIFFALLVVFQEVSLGMPIVILNVFGIAALAALGGSLLGETVGLIFFEFEWKAKDFWIGAAIGMVVALVALFLV